MPYTYQYPRPAVTVDCLITCLQGDQRQILLIRRKNEPYRNQWALPGGFMDINERLADAARRELEEETGLKINYLEQFHVFDEPGRDPRGRTITVVFTGQVKDIKSAVRPASDTTAVKWFPIDELPELAFDHCDIIKLALMYNRI
jgi:8-oxo-dGTP diphosphatase